ncbi:MULTISPECIES: MarR family winged helix-turn-helix transcriptional regulator [Subtercola]|uniref:MarR family winged helix-turn-helix transcriptional regulator n=1 Tax=Subtercola TaxID=120212 RepID=UPI001375D5C4|nr:MULTISPECIES: MarR family transcriptional regulator [Subtercola]MEA9984222.1 MarR family transcriptional regulator [Subtercola sp. RTI3]
MGEIALVDATLLASRALLGVVARSMIEALTEVTLPQFRVLVVVSGAGQIRIGDLAARMGAVQSTFSRSVQRMVSAGWLNRTPSPDSRREIVITITAKGQALVDQVTASRRTELARILSALSEEEQVALTVAFDTFTHAAGEIPLHDLLTIGL